MPFEKFETEKEEINMDHKGSKKIIILLISLIVLLLIAIGILIFFLLKDDSDSDSDTDSNSDSDSDSDTDLDESPFNKTIKDDEINLIPKSGKYDYVLIFIHGLTGNSSENLEKFDKKDGPIPGNFKIILPCAPVANVSRLGFNTTSWFDITGINNDIIVEEDINFDDLDKSANRIKQIIENEVTNVDGNYSRIFVGGFSQGACLSYHVGLSFEHTLGGIIPFCGIPVSKTEIQENNKKDLNIYSILGGKDIYINLNYAMNKTLTVLSKFEKLKIEIFQNEEHAVKEYELEYVKTFIKSLLWL